ncbi:hypothetical protein ACFFK7_12280 [Pseudoalteromonas xiamenensis]|uniref:hypothetical protein n=1 Tax=Pseudoalteromonas xiamenensis TaxID=882626 RepID=UPI0035E61AA0
MKPFNKAVISVGVAAVCMLSNTGIAQPQIDGVEAQSSAKLYRLKLNCQQNPLALQQYAARGVWFKTQSELEIRGECQGPVTFESDNISIVGDSSVASSIKSTQTDKSAVTAIHSVVNLKNLTIAAPSNVQAFVAKGNSTVTLENITTNSENSDGGFYPFSITDNSTAYVSKQSQAKFRVSGSSAIEFQAENTGITLNVLDTSFARSTSGSQFSSVEVSGNGYFLADNQSSVALLMIWSKGAVDVDNQSTVGHLMMGGQTLFAAYRESSILGPYEIYGNVVFELEHSTATGWTAVDKPHSIFTGNDAVVNGVLYPSWSWYGQDGQ